VGGLYAIENYRRRLVAAGTAGNYLMKTAIAVLLVCTGLQAQNQSVRVMFVGDIMLDYGPGHLITNGEDPFAPTAAVLHDADVTVGNLECAITRRGHWLDKPYVFKGPRAALPLLKKYFTAVSLANNHAGDWGPEGFADELALLREDGIPFFGGGDNGAAAAKPLIVEKQGKRIALLAFCDYPPHSFAATSGRPGTAWLDEKTVIRAIKDARRQADYVLLYLHWGIELEERPEAYQPPMARRFIDAGADAIIGAHPHVTQTVEWYRGRPIVYSLGNFVFDYFPGDPRIWTAWMARLSLGAGETIGLELFHIQMDPAGVPHLTSTQPDRIVSGGLERPDRSR